jgi:hypothetical protein
MIHGLVFMCNFLEVIRSQNDNECLLYFVEESYGKGKVQKIFAADTSIYLMLYEQNNLEK